MTTLRVLAGLNAAFQLPLGLCAVFAPALAAPLVQLPLAPGPGTALVRMFGGLLVTLGLLSATCAGRGAVEAWFARLVAAALLGNVAADAVVLAAGELGVDALGAGMALEAAFAVALLRAASRLAAPGVGARSRSALGGAPGGR